MEKKENLQKGIEPTKKYKSSGIRYPMYDLSDGIKVINGIHSLGGKADVSVLAQELKYTASTVQHHINSAKHYGLVEQTKVFVSNTEIANGVCLPISEDEKATNLVKAFFSCELFSGLFDRFKGNNLPPVETIANILHREYKLSVTAKSQAADNFISSGKLACLIKDVKEGGPRKCATVKNNLPVWEEIVEVSKVQKEIPPVQSSLSSEPQMLPIQEFEEYKRKNLSISVNPTDQEAISKGIKFLQMLLPTKEKMEK